MQNWDYDVDLISLEIGPPGDLADDLVDHLLHGGPNERLLAALNRRGQSGWELISVVPVGTTHVRAIFKKPAETPEERRDRVEHERLMRRSKGRSSS